MEERGQEATKTHESKSSAISRGAARISSRSARIFARSLREIEILMYSFIICEEEELVKEANGGEGKEKGETERQQDWEQERGYTSFSVSGTLTTSINLSISREMVSSLFKGKTELRDIGFLCGRRIRLSTVIKTTATKREEMNDPMH